MKRHFATLNWAAVACALVFVCTGTTEAANGDYRSNGTGGGNWTALATWEADYGAGFVAATDYPGQNAGTLNVLIRDGDAVTLDVSPANPIGSLSIGAGASGSLACGAGNAVNVTGDVDVASGAAFDVVGNAHSFTSISGTGTITNTGAAATLTVNNGGAVAFNGTLAGANLSLVKQGAGTLTLSGANTYSGGTTLTAGTLIVNNATALGAAAGSLTVNGGTLDLNAFSIAAGSLAGAGGTITDNSAGAGTTTLTVNPGSGTTFSGVIQNGGTKTLAFTKDGAGTQTLGGANTYSGGTTLTAGTLNINNATAIGSGTFTISGGTIDNTSGGTITLTNNNVQNWNGDFSFTGTNALVLGSGAVTLSANRQVTVGGILYEDGAVGGGAVSLTKAGTGTLWLRAASTYSGGTQITDGAIIIANASAMGTGNVNVAAPARLWLDSNGAGFTVANNITLNGIPAVDAALVGSRNGGAHTNTLSGTLTLAAPSNVRTFSGVHTLSITGQITGAGGLTVDRPAGEVPVIVLSNTANNYQGNTTINGAWLQLGASDVVPDGAAAGNVVLTGAALTGGLNLNGFSDTINGLSGGNGVVSSVNNAGAGASTLTVGGNNATSTFDGVIRNTSGALALTKIGAGIQTLSGANANTHTGATTVNDGVLELSKDAGIDAFAGALNIGDGAGAGNSAVVRLVANDNQIPNTTAVSISADGQLDLNGRNDTIGSLTNSGAGNVTGTGLLTLNGSPLAPQGGSIGDLNTTAITLSLTTGYNADLDGIGPTFDRLNAGTSNVNLNLATLNPNLANSALGDVYVIVQTGAPGAVSGTFNGQADGSTIAAGGRTLQFDYQSTLVRLVDIGAAPASADYVWTGAGGDANWMTDANWFLDVNGNRAYDAGTDVNALKPATGANLFFPSGAAQIAAGNNNFPAATSFNSLTFSDTGYTIAGNQITLGAGGITATGTAGTNALNTPLSLAATRTITTTAGTLTLGGVISETAVAGLTKTGTGTLTLVSANTFTGTTMISQGTVRIDHAQAAGTGAVTLGDAGTGANNVQLTANFASWTIDTPPITVANQGTGTATIALTTQNQGLNSTITLNRATTITASPAAGGAYVNFQPGGKITGSVGALTLQSTSGSLYIGSSGVNDFVGTVDMPLGTVYTFSASAFGTTNPLVMSGTSTLGLYGADLTIDSLTGAAGNTINTEANAGSNRTLTVSSAASTAYAGVITGGGGLTKAGGGTLTLSGNNTYTGATNVNAGVLLVNGSQANSAVTVNAGGTLGGFGTIGALTGSAAATATVSPGNTGTTAATLNCGNVNLTSNNTTFYVNIMGAASYDQLNVTGTVNLNNAVLAGAVDGAYTPASGSTYTIVLNDNGPDAVTGTFNGLAQGATVTLSGYEFTISYVGGDGNDVVLTKTTQGFYWDGGSGVNGNWNRNANWDADGAPGGGSTLIFGRASPGYLTTNNNNYGNNDEDFALVFQDVGYQLNGDAIDLMAAGIDNTAAIAAAGTNTITNNVRLVASQVWNNPVAGRVLVVSGNVNLNGFDLTINGTDAVTISGIISGNGNLVKNGGGTLTLSGNNTFTGSLTVNAGTVAFGHNNGAGNAANTITVNGGALQASGAARTIAQAVTVGGSFAVSGANDLTLSGAMDLGGAGRTVTVSNTGVTTFSGALSNGAGLTKDGAQVLVLSGNNTYAGTTTINGGTLRVQGGNAIPNGSAVTLANTAGAGLDLANSSETIGALSGGGGAGGNIALGSGTLTVTQTAALSYDGVIGGTGGLTKAGGSTLTLTGAQTYTGATLVSAGTLVVNGSLAGGAGATTINAGNTLAGTGTVQAITANGFVAPANAAATGVLNGASANFSGGGTLNVEIPSNLAADRLTLSGGLTLGGTSTLALDLNGYGVATPNQSFTVASGGSITNTFTTVNVVGNLSGKTVYWAYTATEVQVGIGTAPPGAVAPTVSSIVRANASPTNAASVDFTVTFSEAVTGVNAGDFLLTTTGVFLPLPSITNVAPAGPASVYTVTVNTGGGDGTIRLDVVDDDSIIDAGNVPLGGIGLVNGDFNTGQVYTIDKTAPTVTSVTPSVATIADANVGPGGFTLTVVFGEAMNTGVNPTIAFPVESPAGTLAFASGNWPNGTTYVATYDVADAGTTLANIDVRVTLGQDVAGNAQTQFDAADNFSIDTQNPTVTITSGAPNPTNTSPIPVTITFSESVGATFLVGEITVGNGAAGNLAGGPTVFTANITPAGQGLVTVDVNAGVAQDAAGNNNTAAVQLTRTYDSVPPTVAITTGAPNPTNTSPIPVTITFNENVSGFAVGEIVVGNGSASNLAGGPAVYTANITPAGQGLVTVDVGAGVAQDAATNGNTAAPQFSITYDTVQPTVSITSGAPNPTNTSPIPVTITFSEPVGATFVVGEITVGNGAAGNFAGGPTVFTANITPAGQGAVTVDVNAGVAQDAATNGNTAAAQFSITYDTVPPTVSSSNRAGANPTNGATVTFTVTFSENVSGVDVTDFTPVMGGGVAGAAVQSVIGGPAAYTVTVSTGTGDGTLALDVADDDTIADAAGNRLGGTGLGNGAFTGGQAYTVDKTRPIVMNVVGQTANGVYTTGANIDIRITFSSNLTVDTTGGTPTLLLETGATDRTAAYTNQPAADTLEFRYTVVAGDSSTDLSYVDNASLAANGGTIRDGANNEAILTLSDPGLAGSLSFNSAIVIDATPPSVGAIASQSMLEDQASAAIAFTVTDLETALGSLTVTAVSDTQGLIPDANLSIANLGGGNRTITVTSPVANQNGGPVTITLTVTDQVGLTGNTTFQMTVTAVNDVPSFTAGANQSVAEDAGAQTAATWATAISRGPANEAAQAVDFIVTNDNNALFAAQPAVSAAGDLTYTPAANVNGSATVSVQIHDSGGTANGGVDTSAVQQFTITVTPVNDNPAVTLPSVPVTYLAVPAAPAAVIDANATVYDVDADGAIQQALQPDFNGGRLTVSVNGYNQPEDQTAIQTGGNITLNVANVLWTGIVIGTFSGGTNGTTPLQVDLNASATPAAVQDLARAIVFTNTAINPTNFGVNPSRAFDFVLTDGDGGTSATATQTVLITTVNQPPTIDLNGAAAGTGYTTTLSEGFGPVAIVDGAALTVSDPDELRLSGATIQITNLLDGAAESLSVTPSGGIAAGNISYDAATGVLAITANAVLADYQAVLRTAVYNNTAPVNNTTRNISFVVRDSANTSTAATCLVALNTRPRAGSGLVVRFPVMNAGETQGFTVDATDAENDALTYTFDFGDGTQSAPNLTDPAITHLYNDIPANAVQNADGTYTITASVTVTDHPAGVPGGSVTLTATFILGNPIQGNPIDDLDTFNPIPPMGIKSQGNSGVLRFDIVNCTNPVTSQMIPMGAVNSPLSTFLSPAAATFDGTRYFVKFKQPGIYLATATDANGNIARKMVPITVQEANNQPRVVQDIDISASFITGKFHFQSNRPDMVTFRGRFPLQNFTAGAHTLVIGIGNVVSSWTIDARGKGTLLSLRDATGNPRTDAQARLRFKGPRPTDSLNRAVLDLKVKMPDMDVGGFNSEGVTEAYGTAVTTPETVLDPMTSTLTKDPNTGEIVFVERTVNLEPGDLRPLAVQAVFLIDDTAAFAAKIRVGYAVRNGFGQLVGKSSKTGQ